MNQDHTNNSLTAREKEIINCVFNNGGYVLDFTNSTFASFTKDSIGLSIKDKYGMSKGASLLAYFNDADDQFCAKLLNDLIQKRRDMDLLNSVAIDEEEERRLAECQKIVGRLSNCRNVPLSQKILIDNNDFNTRYIDQQVRQMYESIDSNPTDAIGKAKELLESCAKTILKERDVAHGASSDFNVLVKMVYKELSLHRDCVPDDKKASETIKKILSSISTIVSGVNELRNSYGTGHGKEKNYKGLSRRHALLVVGIASAAVMFLWDTHKLNRRRHTEVAQG